MTTTKPSVDQSWTEICVALVGFFIIMSVVGLKIMRNDIFLCIWHIILKLFLRILYPNIGHSVSPSLNNDSSPDSSESGDSRDTTYLKHITVDSESIHITSESSTDSISQSEYSRDSRNTIIIISESSVYPKSSDISVHSSSHCENRSSSRETMTWNSEIEIQADRIIHDIRIHRNSNSSISHISSGDRPDINPSEVFSQDEGVQNNEYETISSRNNSDRIPDSSVHESNEAVSSIDPNDMYQFIAGQKKLSNKYEDMIALSPEISPVSSSSSSLSESRYLCTRSGARYVRPNYYRKK